MKKAFLKKGYSLVEMLIYISILSIFSVALINSLVSFSKSYREVTTIRLLERVGIDSMERISRDIKRASTVDMLNSVFNTSSGVLSLVETYNGNSTTTKFYLDNNVLKVDVNGVYEGPLTSSLVRVTSLIFYSFAGTNSSGVKFEITLQTGSGGNLKTKKYISSSILRGI
jgi:type II secretory pathway pseudopilin PulG